MTIDDFQLKLTSRYEKMDREDVTFIGKELEGYDPEHYEAIYTEFLRSYKYKTPPGIANIVAAIEKLGIKKKTRYRQTFPMAFVCSECGIVYSGKIDKLDAYCCPSCMSFERSIIENPDNSNLSIKTMQTMCFSGWQNYIGRNHPRFREDIPVKQTVKCPNYGQHRAMGPVCEIYDTRISITQECRDCVCASCCANRREEIKTMAEGKQCEKAKVI
jgi:hypothetical protein